MLARLEAARREAGRAAIQAQERERRRIAQDLHDEVNQALTAVSLRLQASIEHAPAPLRRELDETKRLAGQAMEELLALARQLRPAVLDDHGLLPGAPQPGARLLRPDRHPGELQRARPGLKADARAAAGRLPGDPGEPVERRPALGGAGRSTWSCRSSAAPSCGSTTTGRASSSAGKGASGCRGCASARLLVGGQLTIWSAQGQGTRVELTLA